MKAIKRLPDAELEVMQALWSCTPPASRSDIETVLQSVHPMAVTTLLTVLTRLGGEGLPPHRKSYYTPIVAQKDYLAAQSRTFVQKVCRGSLPAFAAALCDSGLTREELDQLRELLERDAL